MMFASVMLVCTAWGALFEVHAIPLASADARIMVVPADRDATADLFVLENDALTAYPSALNYTACPVGLPAGTSAFDVFDLDTDGQTEVVAVSGDRIMLCPIPLGDGAAPRELFRLHTLLADEIDGPFPWVLGMRSEHGQPTLALPCETTVEVCSSEGERMASYPAGPDAPRRVSMGRPFDAWASAHPVLGPQDSLEVNVSRELNYEPDLPRELFPLNRPTGSYCTGQDGSVGSGAHADDNSAKTYLEIDDRPWRPARLSAEGTRAALCNVADDGCTQVRFVDASADGTLRAEKAGPVRRYPGALAGSLSHRVDFNGDGYADLVLWKSPEPAMSIDALTRTVLGETWPIRLTVHLYSPEQGAFESTPGAHLECRIPVTWFLSAQPLRNIVLRDFDGDGKTDLAFSVADRAWSVWLWRGTFNEAPDQVITLNERIEYVAFQVELEENKRTSVGLRTRHGIHLLRPTQ